MSWQTSKVNTKAHLKNVNNITPINWSQVFMMCLWIKTGYNIKKMASSLCLHISKIFESRGISGLREIWIYKMVFVEKIIFFYRFSKSKLIFQFKKDGNDYSKVFAQEKRKNNKQTQKVVWSVNYLSIISKPRIS